MVLRQVYRHSPGGGSPTTIPIPRSLGRSASRRQCGRVQSASINGGDALQITQPELMAADQPINASTPSPSEIIYIDEKEFKHRLHEAVGAEIEAAVEAVVHEVLEAELGAVQESVAEVGC